MSQKFVPQEEFDDFVLTVANAIPKNEDLARVKEEVCQRIDGLEGKMLRNFDSVWERFHEVDGRLDGIDGRLDGIDGRLDRLEQAVMQILERLPKP